MRNGGRRLIALLVAFLACATGAHAQGTIIPFISQAFYDASGNPVSGGKLCAYVAGTTTPQSTYSDVTLGTPNANPIILSSNGRPTTGAIFLSPANYKFVLMTAGSDSTCSTGTTLWTLDNIAATPPFFAQLDVTGTSGEAIAAGDVVYLSDGSGGNTAGRWYKANATANYASSTAVMVGMAPAAISGGSTGLIRLQGRQSAGLSGLTAGTLYYAATTGGALTSTAPTNARVVGIADSTSSLVMAPNPARFGVISGSGDIIESVNAVIRRDTSDAADSGQMTMVGGGATGQSRGAQVQVMGNENAAPGYIQMYLGNVTGSQLNLFKANGSLALQIMGADPSVTTINGSAIINQAGADDAIFQLKSSDVAHGITGVAETDTYLFMQKQTAASGGGFIRGLSSSGSDAVSLRLGGISTVATGTRSMAALATVVIDAQLKSGTSTTSIGADKNILAIRDDGAARIFFDSDGDAFQDAGTVWTNFDSHDDVSVLNTLAVELARPGDVYKDSIKARFASDMNYLLPRDEMQRIGLVEFNPDGHHFVNMSRLTMLNVGAIRQVGDRQRATDLKLAAVERELATTQALVRVLWQQLQAQAPLRASSPSGVPIP